MNYSRRTFIKSGLLITSGLPFLKSCSLGGNPNDTDILFKLFQNPPSNCKPFVRWWWNGDKLSTKEILRELDVMKEAGIGGVEINPIAFPGGDDLQIPSMEWLSPEWIEMIKVTLKGAEERDMTCDIIVGSGWPFGGEFLEKEERSQLLTLTSRKVKGPVKLQLKTDELLQEATPEVHSKYDGLTSEIHTLCLAPIEMSSFSPSKSLTFEKGSSFLSIDVPEGEHILYALVKVTGFQAVINGAPGASGPVLNHFNPVAVQKFLNRMSDHLFPAIRELKGFRALFCDSMELEGANWCSDFPEEFQRLRGYDVTPYLPFILYKVGHMGHAIETVSTILSGAAKEEVSRVRYDFFITCMDLMRERFLKPYTAWCNKHGFQSRVQAYGREFHPLDSSFDVDIPECETWLWYADSEKKHDFSTRSASTNVNKYVASAARFSGKKVISCEEITNTGVVFNASLERIKAVGDQSNLSGVTHSILHGFNYSPPETPFPGWVRYGTYFNERNPWWPFFKEWAAYKTRLSALLQETEYVADIAVLHPLADMWTKHGPQRDPFPELLYPEYQYKIWETIHQNGNSCDYISEKVIQQSSFDKGFLTFNSRKYHTLILIEVETLIPATALALVEFVKNGGKLICIGKEPYQSPGLSDYLANNEKVKQAIELIRQTYPSQFFRVEAPEGDIIQWYKVVQQRCDLQPYVKIDNPSPYMNQIYHRTEDQDIFFFANCSIENKVSFQATFSIKGKKPYLWNPETGERSHYPTLSGDTLLVELYPASSQLIVFDKNSIQTPPISLPKENTTPIELNGWHLRLEHINGQFSEQMMETLTDLSTNPETLPFAGHLIYTKEINGSTDFHYIDLGKVYGVSEVIVNGETLGNKWYGRHFYLVPDHLASAASQKIQVKITTTVGNYLKSSTDNPVGQTWTRHQDWQPMGMLGPIRLL